MNSTLHTQRGFTLVELSIVLVIIGLVLGGIWAARDMIQNAEIRRFITHIEQFDVAANTFRTKFGGLPGDIHRSRTAQFGLENVGSDGSDGSGDGDGLLENGAVFAHKGGVGGENTLFWKHITSATLVPYDLPAATGSIAVTIPDDATMKTYLPHDKVREILDYHVHSDLSRNYYYLAAMNGAAATTGLPVEDDGLEVISAERVDVKLDDGFPLTGIVTARDNLYTIATPAPAAAGVCVENVNGLYNLAPDFRDVIACRLRIRASF